MHVATDNGTGRERRLVVRDDALSMVSLRTAIELAAEERGLTDEATFDLKVAATEAVANALRHADASDGVEVALRAAAGGVDVEILSPGRFRVADALDPERGRGLPLIVALADLVQFERRADATRVRIRKRRGEPLRPLLA